jgi:hypothetical protein
MALSFLYLAFVKILQLLRRGRRDSCDLTIEIVMLRHEVAVLLRQVVRPALRPPDRALLAGLSRLITQTKLHRFFVQPETLLRWHRELVRRNWTYPRPSGRPSIPAGTVQVMIRLARESLTWGYRRIHGELARTGVVQAPASGWNILRRHGLDPSPNRTGPTWVSSSKHRPLRCWPATSSLWTPCSCGGCTSSLGQLPPQPKVVVPVQLKNVDPSRLNRTNRLGGAIHEYRLVA